MKYSIVIPLTIMLIAGCSLKNQPISQIELYVRYEADTQKLLAEASFNGLNERGKLTPINMEGGVAFLNSNMERKELPGGKIRYSYDHKLDLPSTLSLSWKNPDGNKINIIMDATKTSGFNFLPENDNITISFDGPPLSKEESFILLFTDAHHKMLNKQITGPTESRSISLPKSELSELANGTGQLSIVRTNNFIKKGNGYVCNINYSYYSTPIEVQQ